MSTKNDIEEIEKIRKELECLKYEIDTKDNAIENLNGKIENLVKTFSKQIAKLEEVIEAIKKENFIIINIIIIMVVLEVV